MNWNKPKCKERIFSLKPTQSIWQLQATSQKYYVHIARYRYIAYIFLWIATPTQYQMGFFFVLFLFFQDSKFPFPDLCIAHGTQMWRLDFFPEWGMSGEFILSLHFSCVLSWFEFSYLRTPAYFHGNHLPCLKLHEEIFLLNIISFSICQI